MSTPPRLNGLWRKQQSFRKHVEPLIWNFVVENEIEDHDNTIDGSLLLPSQIQDNTINDSLLPSTPAEADIAVNIPAPIMGNKKRKSNEAVPILLPPDVSGASEKYPRLSWMLGQHVGFNPTEPRTKKIMESLLVELVDLLSTEYELVVKNSANKRLSYVRVPTSSSNRSFQNSKEWVDTAIKIAGSTHGGTFESAYRIANHLIRFYKDSVLAALETQRIPVCKPMSATEFSAMVKAGNINVMGEKELKKHLRSHLGRGFCPTSRSVNMLSEGHGEIYYGNRNNCK